MLLIFSVLLLNQRGSNPDEMTPRWEPFYQTKYVKQVSLFILFDYFLSTSYKNENTMITSLLGFVATPYVKWVGALGVFWLLPEGYVLTSETLWFVFQGKIRDLYKSRTNSSTEKPAHEKFANTLPCNMSTKHHSGVLEELGPSKNNLSNVRTPNTSTPVK